MKILHFISTPQPTNYDRQISATVGVPVQYRSLESIDHNAPAEACDGVLGAVIPDAYLDKPYGVPTEAPAYVSPVEAPSFVAPVEDEEESKA